MPEFYEVEGKIPVALAVRQSEVPEAFLPASWDAMGYSMAWDTDPPRPFDYLTARRTGEPLNEANFWSKVAQARRYSLRG